MTIKRYCQDSTTESLGRFVGVMASKLARNEHKGGWRDSGALPLLKRLLQETRELKHAIISGDPEKIAEEAADVANFAMMIQDLFWNNDRGK